MESSPEIIENPFIKPANREWSVSVPKSLSAPVSPPRSRQKRRLKRPGDRDDHVEAEEQPRQNDLEDISKNSQSIDLARIEAGKASVENHLEVWSAALLSVTRPTVAGLPRLPHDSWVDLYRRNQLPQGRHFVIHQHNHPIAGPHYDLRLQISQSSSVSFAIMYGLPGNPNSGRLNRNATETRVHNLWNHLIESGSASTGSLLIWDTGEYSILPYKKKEDPADTDQSRSELSDSSLSDAQGPSESEKLHTAFQQRKIRLRLHGTRLPPNYTVSMRLPVENDRAAQPDRPSRKRRKRAHTAPRVQTPSPSPSTPGTPSESETRSSRRLGSTPADDNMVSHSDADEDEVIRRSNAYPGATNSIGSIHQRRWYLTLDRVNSGFEKRSYHDGSTRKQEWVRRKSKQNGEVALLGFEPFYVRGPDVERSVVTGRLSADVLRDEGVQMFIERKGWRPVLY